MKPRKCTRKQKKCAENRILKYITILVINDLHLHSHLKIIFIIEFLVVFTFIGLCYMNLGEWDKSKEYFQRTIQLSRNQDAYEKLASIFAMENNLKNATSILITATRLVIENILLLKIQNNFFNFGISHT